MPDISYTSDQNGRTIYISPNVKRYSVYSSQEVYAEQRTPAHRILAPRRPGSCTKRVEALFETQTTFDEEFRIRNKSGRSNRVHDRQSEHTKKTASLCNGILSDITARKEAELDLQSKTALLEAQVNSTIDGILVIDPSGQKILQNTRFTEIFDIPIALFEQTDDRPVLNYAVGLMKSPEEFLAKVEYLYAHPMEMEP